MSGGVTLEPRLLSTPERVELLRAEGVEVGSFPRLIGGCRLVEATAHWSDTIHYVHLAKVPLLSRYRLRIFERRPFGMIASNTFDWDQAIALFVWAVHRYCQVLSGHELQLQTRSGRRGDPQATLGALRSRIGNITSPSPPPNRP